MNVEQDQNQEISILIVDDETNILKSLRRLFMDDDYEIYTADSGLKGLQILEENQLIQIVISDYRMPDMNGVDFLRKVYERWPETIRIVLSGFADIESVILAINEGNVYKFIAKPWNNEEIRVTIVNAIDTYNLQQKNATLAKELKRKNDELKQLLQKRTEESASTKKLLSLSQNIFEEVFYSMPVGMLGIEADGTIVECNARGLELLHQKKGDLIMADRNDTLPDSVNDFIDLTIENQAYTGSLLLKQQQVNAKGFIMKRSIGWVGIIIVFGWAEPQGDSSNDRYSPVCR